MAVKCLSLRQLPRVASGESSDQRRGEWIAFVCALGFAVHPVVSEVVCWVKCLDDLMATAFTLAATLALLHWQPEGSSKSYWLAFGLFVLALYSKLSAVPFVVVVFLILYHFKRESWARSLRRGLPFLAAARVFLVHRHLVIGRTSQTQPLSGSYVQTLIDTLPTVPMYLRLAVGMPPFCADYDYLPTGHGWFSRPVLFGGGSRPPLSGRPLPVAQISLELAGVRFDLGRGLYAPGLEPGADDAVHGRRFLYLPLLGGLMAALPWRTDGRSSAWAWS